MKIIKVKDKKSPWKVQIPKALTDGRRVRKFFPSKEEAIAFTYRLQREGVSILDPSPSAPFCSEIAAAWLARSHDKSASYHRQLRLVLGHFCDTFARVPIDQLGHVELDRWLSSLPGGVVYRQNHYRVIKRFLDWAVDWMEVIPRNPMKKVPRPVDDRPAGNRIEILSAGQMREALQSAVDDPRLLAWLALGGFAGLRSQEILWLPWEDVDLKKKEIFVGKTKKVRGWRPRYVKILPALAAVLTGIKGRQGLVFPGGMRELYYRRKAAMDRIGWQRWPQNCLRHSFGTYHLAMRKNAAETAHEMGHAGTAMIYQHYAVAARQADARAWWGIRLA